MGDTADIGRHKDRKNGEMTFSAGCELPECPELDQFGD